ncbi:hypothetical protein BAAA27672_05930 [Bifidobacterium animalis subsp. animalis ATCC 27672]|nr:hypothetical protein BAAA27672_05930 [Bifidobacterium animalis subsp. animalis ATCC 27672]
MIPESIFKIYWTSVEFTVREYIIQTIRETICIGIMTPFKCLFMEKIIICCK